jgi:hypothetical protein
MQTFSPAGKSALSCVVDDVPSIWNSLIPWLATATQLSQVHPKNIHVHHVCALTPSISRICKALGIKTHLIAPFDASNPYTNKIAQCETDFGEVNTVVLTDVDVVFTKPLPLSQIQGQVAGKLVDMPNPPIEVLSEIFLSAGVVPIGSRVNDYTSNESKIEFETLVGNFNGGLYVIPTKSLRAIGERWSYWARWLLLRPKLLSKWTRNTDQVAFCLALSDLSIIPSLLSNHWNYPTHIGGVHIDQEPFIFHHHALLNENQELMLPPDQTTHDAISRVNREIKTFKNNWT